MSDTAISFDRDIIQRQIQNGDYDLARAGLEGALAISPQSVGLTLTKADLHIARGDFSDAVSVLASLVQTPSAIRWAVPRVSTMLETKPDFFNTTGSQLLFQCVDATQSADMPAIEKRNFFDAILRARLGCGIDLLGRIAALAADPKYSLRLATALAEAARVDEAIDVLVRLQRGGHESDEVLMILADLYYVVGDKGRARDLADELLNRTDLRPLYLGRVIALLRRLGLTELALAHTIRALEAGKLDFRLMDHAVRVAMPDQQRSEMVRLLSAIPAAMKPPLLFYTAIAHLLNGDVGTTLKLLSEELPSATEAMAGPLRQILTQKSVGDWKSEERAAVNFGRDVQVRKGSAGRPVVLWVSGVKASLLPQYVIDAALQDLDYTVVYFNLHTTVQGNQTISTLLEQHRHDIEEYLGCSLAGASMVVGVSGRVGLALEMALLLKVPTVLGFGSIIDADTYYSDTKPSLWNPEFLRALASRMGDNVGTNVLRLLTDNPQTSLINYLGADYARDVSQARLLDGCKNARSIYVEGVADHLILNHLYASGQLLDVFRSLVES
ncbi:tetratricopeptide repeat protein [Kordiimonas aestuarii]|uniref:tetratricopeptide repeat protein n=1 Tax=Kordiimonas aestuarii TaxID=1005925 RepID=UPI0021CEDCEE|nr:tetratricopeptide repeat protein [Kordiimonas aestuarii]